MSAATFLAAYRAERARVEQSVRDQLRATFGGVEYVYASAIDGHMLSVAVAVTSAAATPEAIAAAVAAAIGGDVTPEECEYGEHSRSWHFVLTVRA